MILRVLIAEITTLSTDAIVNAANTSLLGGGGVDGAIHRAAGPGLLAECAALGGCKTGEAKVTGAYNLPTRYVIHTVGPVWRGGHHDEDRQLASAYSSSMKCAFALNIQSIAFPAIATGVYGFPAQRAARIAVTSVKGILSENTHALKEIIFCCFSKQSAAFHEEVLNQS